MDVLSPMLSSLISATAITIGVAVSSPITNTMPEISMSNLGHIFITAFVVFMLIQIIAAAVIYIITTPRDMKQEDNR